MSRIDVIGNNAIKLDDFYSISKLIFVKSDKYGFLCEKLSNF
jgi:hypothetical protein